MDKLASEITFFRAISETKDILNCPNQFNDCYNGSELFDVLNTMMNVIRTRVEEYTSEALIQAAESLQKRAPPSTELGALALALATNIYLANTTLNDSFACEVAEARFLQSVYQLEEPYLSTEDKARVYLDIDGNVIAYKKHRGDPTTLALSACDYLPGLIPGTIVNILSTGRAFQADILGEALPATANPQLEVVAITDGETTFVSNLRPSAFALSSSFRSAVGFTGIDPYDYRTCSFGNLGSQTATVECEQIKEQVAQRVAEAIS